MMGISAPTPANRTRLSSIGFVVRAWPFRAARERLAITTPADMTADVALTKVMTVD
ncbi:hypothetical protein [Sphingomonas sp. 22176]|uniref:hypothetical protein n=1 Tax=Sphingomonas sp. 22176 TaxID=3453884 RepID=UPI003F839C46